MRINDIIIKKRDGGALTKDEIQFFVDGYTAGEIPDYQASALLMAIYFQGMNKEETYQLTAAMRDSGDVADLSAISGIKGFRTIHRPALRYQRRAQRAGCLEM